MQGESRETGHGRCGKATGGSLRRTRSRPESVRGSLRRKAARGAAVETDGGGEPVSAPTHRWRTPLGERKGVRSTPSLDDGVERQVAHCSTEEAWLMSPHGHCLWARDCLKTVKESALKIPDARVYCGFLEVYVEGMTRVRLERARARRVRPAPRETRENVHRSTRVLRDAQSYAAVNST